MKNKEKKSTSDVFFLCMLVFMTVSLMTMFIYAGFVITQDFSRGINNRQLIRDTTQNKYNMELLDSSSITPQKEFSGPYLAKNNSTNEVQDVYVLCKDNDVALYKKQNDNYIELES